MRFGDLTEFEPTGKNLAILGTLWMAVVLFVGVVLVVPFQ